MKKILLSLGLIGLGLISFCSAGSLTVNGSVNLQNPSMYAGTSFGMFNFPYSLDYMSISCTFTNFSGTVASSNNAHLYYFFTDSSTYGSVPPTSTLCTFDSSIFNNGILNCNNISYYSKSGLYIGFNLGVSNSTSFSFDYSCTFEGNNIIDQSSNCDYSDYELKSNITESYCTNKFLTLIDESDITSGYCETEFGLIDPENCPASGGTGDIQRSAFFVNSHQVEGASNIYLYLPDFLNWDYTYLNSGSTLEINVENQGDEDYINSLLAVETYHPSSDDFTQSFTGTITLLMPYIIIVLFILFIWRLIKRIFK